MAMRILPSWNNDLCIKIQPHDIQGTLQFIEKKWKSIYPEYPFEFSFLDDQLNNLYLSEERIGTLFRYFTSIAIIISCLGLFGLASFLAEERTKEVGIRKVLGASIPGLMVLLSKDYIKWVLVANLFAWPIAWYTVRKWLQQYAYKTDVSLQVFILSGCLALFIAFVTVSYQTIKAAIANPTDSLKYE
jgi:putative ABC transport system permease protein